MKDLLILSCICASISFTITESKLFEEFRNYMELFGDKIGKLFKCGYCLGHYISFFLVIIYGKPLFNSNFIMLDYFITSIFIAWISGWQWMIFSWILSKSGK